MMDIYVAKKAKYDEYWAWFTSYDEDGHWHSDDQLEKSDEAGTENSDDVEYIPQGW